MQSQSTMFIGTQVQKQKNNQKFISFFVVNRQFFQNEEATKECFERQPQKNNGPKNSNAKKFLHNYLSYIPVKLFTNQFVF